MNSDELKERMIQDMLSIGEVLPEVVQTMMENYTLICEYMYTPTELGISLDEVLSSRRVNKILQELGFQYKDNKEWKLTIKGSEYGACTPHLLKVSESEQGKSYSINYRIRWKKAVIEVINTYIRIKERQEVA